jgi:hypothetical protein
MATGEVIALGIQVQHEFWRGHYLYTRAGVSGWTQK